MARLGAQRPAIALSVATVLLAMAAAGCKRRQSPAENWKTVHFAMYKPERPDVWNQAFARFEQEHPSLRVVREAGPQSAAEFHDLLLQKLREGDGTIDVFLMDVVWPSEFARAGYLASLDDVIPAAERKVFFSAPLLANTVDGRLYGVPFDIDAGILYYRKDLLDKYGLGAPRTWEELLVQVATVLEGEGREGLYGFTGQFKRDEGLVCSLLEFVHGNGGRFLDESGAPAVLDPKTIEAVRFVRDRIIDAAAPRSVLTDTEPESREKFARGDAVFHRGWPETWNLLQDPDHSQVVGQVGLATIPRFRADGPTVAALGGWQLAVARHSKRKEAAFELVRFLASKEVQRDLTLETAQNTARVDLYDDAKILGRFPHFKGLKAVFLTAEPRPQSPIYATLSDVLQDFLYQALSRRDSNIEALARAASKRLQAETERLEK